MLAALLLSAGCGGAKETSADETAGNVPAVAEQKTDSKADMELSETLEVDAGSISNVVRTGPHSVHSIEITSLTSQYFSV